MPRDRSASSLSGTLMVLGSSAAFGALPIFGKYAYAAGLSPQQLLSFRFTVAAAAVLLLARARGERLEKLPWRGLLGLLAMGGVAYFIASVVFFVALESLPASLCELIQFIYPTLVAVEAWILFGRPISAVHAVALAISLTGAALLVGTISLKLDAALVLALISPLAYSAYLIAGEHVLPDGPILTRGGIVLAGAAISFTAYSAVTGELRPPASQAQWSILLATTLLTGIVAVPLLLGGLARLGAGRASIVGLAEPVLTVVLAALLLRERLAWTQVLGAALVLGAVLLLQVRRPAAIPQSPTPR